VSATLRGTRCTGRHTTGSTRTNDGEETVIENDTIGVCDRQTAVAECYLAENTKREYMSSTNGVPAHPAIQEFRKILTDGVQTDIYLALESHGIIKTVGERVDAANASSFQPALLALQAYASAIFILSLAALLEREGQTYKLHSVHGVLKYLRENAANIPLKEPVFLEQSMRRLGAWDSVPHDPGVAQTHAVVDVLIAMLPHPTNNAALKALKDQRDKRIAHPERVDANSLAATTWDEALKLLNVPREALAVCGAFTSTAYVDNQGRLFAEGDAAFAAAATRRILELPPREK